MPVTSEEMIDAVLGVSTLPEDLRAEVVALAEERNLTPRHIIAEAVREYLEGLGRIPGDTQA